jgi:poly-beta-hydroxyalkanoate depolymerase
MANKLDNLKKGDGFDTHPERINREGRPRKYVSLLKEQGYKLSEINDSIQAMMAMDLEELKGVFENPKATILEKTVANAMKKSLEKGSLYSIETLLTRVYGKPKEQMDINTDNKIEIVFVDGKTIL